MVEVKGTSVPHSSRPVPPPIALAPPKTASSSSTSQQPSEHIPVTSRDFLAVMDSVRTFATTFASFAAAQTALAERMARAEVALSQNQAILLQIQSHLGLSQVIVIAHIQPTTNGQFVVSASLDVLAAAVVASDPPASDPPTSDPPAQ